MGDVVALNPGRSFSSPSSTIVPDWPHPRTVTIAIEHARAIDRDIRHLEAVMERARDTTAISTILSTIYGANSYAADKAARKIGDWIRTGQAPAV